MIKRMACTVLLLTVSVASAQTFTTLVEFDGKNGANENFPTNMSLVQGRDGDLYGMTRFGGHLNSGTIFRITPEGVLKTLHYFCQLENCADGSSPLAGLILGKDGNFYGTATLGGSYGFGTVFKISPAGALTTLYSFCAETDCTDGTYPESPLIQASDGNFYGTTVAGGTNGGGTVFKMTPQGTLTTLYRFCVIDTCPDGSAPFSGLVQASDGNFYGTTPYGGTDQGGTFYRVTSEGILTTLYNFCQGSNCSDGEFSNFATLMQASDGLLYDTTNIGGTADEGIVYSITTAGDLTTIYNFCSQPDCSDGGPPFSGLYQAPNGNLYGTTYTTIFELTPGGSLTTLHTFDPATEGELPEGTLLQSTNGSFYGVTNFQGSFNDGTVFELSTGLPPYVKVSPISGRLGQGVQILGQGFTGTTSVSFNGTSAAFTVISDTFLEATVPTGATSGRVKVSTPGGLLISNPAFRVIP